MSKILWKPFDEVEKALCRLRHNQANSLDLAVDLYEEGNNLIAEMNLPGVKPEDINLEVKDRYIRVTGSHTQEKEKESKNKNYYQQEISRGSFERVISLPIAVEHDKVTAHMDNGMLTITLPKRESTQPRKISIQKK